MGMANDALSIFFYSHEQIEFIIGFCQIDSMHTLLKQTEMISATRGVQLVLYLVT